MTADATLRALAEAALPAGLLVAGASAQTAERAAAFASSLSSPLPSGYIGLLQALELAARVQTGESFSSLSIERRLHVLSAWEGSELGRTALRALLVPLKLMHFAEPEVARTLGCERPQQLAVVQPDRIRDRAIAGSTLTDGEEIDCDVVIVGTGAGGAAAAYALASRGHAVLLLEEGEYFTRADFTGPPLDRMAKLYRPAAATVAFGNTAIPIPVGRGVGGTTLINSGTCFRIPDKTLAEWRNRAGLAEFTPSLLAPHYEVVERELGVGPSTKAALGKSAELIARGCDVLGFSHGPLDRNAPGCDGQGECCFGCPTDAKRSTNVSFVPSAIERGAQLVTGIKVTAVLVDDERAVGVVAETKSPAGLTQTVRVRAKAVVLACGALHTPTLLLRQGIANSSGMLGRNLSIHPAVAAIARFDETVSAWNSVPQGYAIDHFAAEGLMFEGGAAPLSITAASLPGFGREYVEFVEDFNRLLTFGFMIKDSSRGRVHRSERGEPRISYFLNDRDLAALRRGLGILCRVFFAAGAREVRVPISGMAPLYRVSDVEALERIPLSARHIDVSAYHPLGTAAMGRDPLSSVVDSTHETHDVHNLFVCDGSAVPGSLGVNPQMTIMAMALRAAEFIDRRLARIAA